MKSCKVATDDGRIMALATPSALGLVPCPGEAHSNAHIDHCTTCLGGTWGQMMTYAKLGPETCDKGFAVAVNDADEDAFRALDGRYRMIGATLKRRGSTSHFYVWIRV